MTALILSGPLQAERLPNGRRKLLRELVVDLGEPVPPAHGFDGWYASGRGTTVVRVPAGFDTDYSSIPFFAHALMGRWDRHDLAGVVHDYAYRIQVPRDAADRVWRIVARSGARRVGPVRGFLGWAGLRVGGWVAYRARRSDEVSLTEESEG